MFGHRYFGARYFGPRYFGPGGSVVVPPVPPSDDRMKVQFERDLNAAALDLDLGTPPNLDF